MFSLRLELSWFGQWWPALPFALLIFIFDQILGVQSQTRFFII
uniref:Rod shape-determining protein MreD n=1 Tax=Romanomermis culicivorax TaxID=13658 RepID=A0A915JT35_ROMCU